LLFFKEKESSKVTFFTDNDELMSRPDLHPQPASKFFPEWFKKVKSGNVSLASNINEKNIKNCPVFAEYLTQGYVIPMWCDTLIMLNTKAGEFQWKTPSSEYKWDYHSHDQFLNHIPISEEKRKTSFVGKTICPWMVKLEKGYSLYQMHQYYNFNEDWEVLPGSIKSDNWPVINQQVFIKTPDKEIFIPAGTPFAWYIPYKREKYNLEVKISGDEEINHVNLAVGFLNSHFKNAYKKLNSFKNSE
jgi:hypothetical protein